MNTPRRDPLDDLRALPELAPPPHLPDRIARAQARRLAHWRTGAAAVTLILAAVCVLPLVPYGPLPDTSPSTALPPAPERNHLADIRAIDRALQTAYERGASEDELAPLWAARARLLSAIARTNDS